MFHRILFATLATSLFAAPPDGAALYSSRCAACHEGKPQPRMPQRAELTARTPEDVFKAMFSGAMMIQAAGLSDEEGRAIARYVTGKEFSTAKEVVAGQCTTPAKAFTIA